jgi:glycolate oxidase iron-sulfur subunit
MKLAQILRPVLSDTMKAKVPARQDAGRWPTAGHARKVLLLAGCVQPVMTPNINSATARVLDAAGIQAIIASDAGCCGAVKFHLNDQEGGKAQMRANIDAWWPHLPEVQAIIMNASGCGVTVKEYGHLLQNDPLYAAKAKRISEATQDLSEWLPALCERLTEKLPKTVAAEFGTIAFHPPCTLQHGQQLRGGVEKYMAQLGFKIRITGAESHLCCGSAGTYSLLNPGLSTELRERKLDHLNRTFGTEKPDLIVSANMGCITHLQSGTATPVRHWVEVLDQALANTL